MQNSVTARQVPGRTPSNSSGTISLVEQGDDPAHRTHEFLARLPPVHVLGPVDGVDFLRQQLGQNLAGGATLLCDGGGEVLALGGADGFELGNVDASLFGERVCCRGWLPVFICDVGEGPVTCSVKIRLSSRDSEASTDRRRGVSKCVRPRPEARRSRFSKSLTRCCSSREAASIIRAGISSVPISSRKSGIRLSIYLPKRD